MLLTCLLACAVPQPADDGMHYARDACEIAALEAHPGIDQHSNPEATTSSGTLRDVAWDYPVADWSDQAKAEWDRCLTGKGIESIFFSPDRKLAKTTGSSGTDVPLGGSWGECYFERKGHGWRLIACVITAMS